MVGACEVLYCYLGTFPVCVQELLKRYPPHEVKSGDAFIMNHPYFSGIPHASDIGLMTPVFYQVELVAFCGTVAHIRVTWAGWCQEVVRERPERFFRRVY